MMRDTALLFGDRLHRDVQLMVELGFAMADERLPAEPGLASPQKRIDSSERCRGGRGLGQCRGYHRHVHSHDHGGGCDGADIQRNADHSEVRQQVPALEEEPGGILSLHSRIDKEVPKKAANFPQGFAL